MFREMRRHGQRLSAAETCEILARGSFGVIACAGDDDYPYGVPVSYVFEGSHIWIHCAPEGHKLDALRRNAKVSFCVVGQDQVVPGKFTTAYRSAIVFGRARILEEEREKREALMKIGLKYEPNREGAAREAIDGAINRTTVIEIAVEHLSGKEGAELMRRRNGHR